MNAKMITLEELSQILAATRISPSQEEHILAATKNLSISPEILEGPKFPELQKYSPYQNMEEAENLTNTPNGERPCRPENEEFPTCNSTDPSCTTKINHLQEEDLYQDYIEIWFQEVISHNTILFFNTF
jgi:hypothetical protein